MKTVLRSLGLPLLVVAYPIVFLYGQNARILNLGILPVPIITALLIAGLAFGIFYLFQRSLLTASLSAVAFVLFFYLYGFIYRELVKLDKFPVQHFVLLPVILVLAGYGGYFIARTKPGPAAAAQKILLSITAALLILNLMIITPVEAQKAAPKHNLVPVTGAVASSGKKLPDVYYIIFDEYVRFDAMREYWHNNDVDKFDAFLKQNHFFVASQSLSPTINTTTEMSSRLNLHQYTEKDDQNMLQNLINNNKVMQIFKAHGYTTVSINMAYSDITADYNYKFNTNEVGGLATDEFEQTYLNDTMFAAFSRIIQDNDPVAVKQRDSILFALDKTANPGTIQSPKFVYTHFLLPHTPFIFDENGNLLPPQDAQDWHYYLGQYKYATKLAMQLVQKLLANADPNNPPVIILQSDEGARNLQSRTQDNIVVNGYLENYPGRYNQYILNALYLPGYDTSKLPADLPPIDTFVIVLNYYLNAGVAVDKTP
jgi:hypothetical protein